MAFTSPPPAPQRGDRATFSSRTDAFLIWLVNLVGQLNSFLSSITTLAAGGANSFSFTFDTAIGDNDPGTGKMRLGSAAQNGSVVMRLDVQAATGGDITGFMSALQAGTSNVKGSVRLQKVADVSSWLLFDITGITNLGGYFNVNLVPRASSMISPFGKDETVMAFFDIRGDKGDGGNTPTQAEMRAAIGTLPIENGGTAASTLQQARINLQVDQVDNTSDANKPLSSTAKAALSGKLSNNIDTVRGQLYFGGTQAAPGVAFDNDTGFFGLADGSIGIACNGSYVGKFTPDGLEVKRIIQTQ